MSEIDRHYAALQKAKAAGDEGAVQIIAGRIRAEQEKQRGAEAISGMTTDQLAAAGIGAGLKNVAMNVRDIAAKATAATAPVTYGVPREELAREGTILGKPPTEEEWAEERRLNQPLLATSYGKGGKIVGEIAGTLPVGMGTGSALRGVAQGASKVLPAAARLARPLGQAMGQGGAVGAVQAGPGERAEGAAIGAAGGALLRGAGKLVGKGVRGLVEATPAAKYLRGKGVDLTVGQMAPRSAIGQFEEAGQSVGGIGPTIANQRQAALKGFQSAALREGAPAGAKVPESLPVQEQLAKTYEAFEAAYAPLKNVSIYPAIHAGGGKASVPLQGAKGAFRQAVMDPKAMATRETQVTVDRFLQDQLSMLPAPKGALPKVSAGALLQIRSNIRDAIRKAGQNQDFAAEKLLKNAESAVTNTLETQLPAQAAKALRAVDAKYAQHMVGEAAVAKAGDLPAGFSPYQLQAALKASMPSGRFARGGGGELRKLSAAGREVFDMRSPPTGARYLTVGPFGWVTAPMAALANQPAPKALLTGQTAVQRRAQAVAEALRRRLGERGVNAAKSLGTTSMSAALQEE